MIFQSRLPVINQEAKDVDSIMDTGLETNNVNLEILSKLDSRPKKKNVNLEPEDVFVTYMLLLFMEEEERRSVCFLFVI